MLEAFTRREGLYIFNKRKLNSSHGNVCVFTTKRSLKHSRKVQACVGATSAFRMTLELGRHVCSHKRMLKLVSHLKRMFETFSRWDKLVFTTSDAETTLEMRKFAYSAQASIRNLTHVLGWLPDSGDVRLILCCACQCRSEQLSILACSNGRRDGLKHKCHCHRQLHPVKQWDRLMVTLTRRMFTELHAFEIS